MASAYNATSLSLPLRGDYEAFDREAQQRSALRTQNIFLPDWKRSNGELAKPSEVGKFYEGQDADVDPESVQAYDFKITELKDKYPDMNLKTSKEIWEETKNKYSAAAKAEEQRRGTTAGAVGGVLGDMAGSMVDPINAATLFVGGELLVPAKAGVLAVMGAEGAAQAGATGISEATGARGYRAAVGGDGSLQGSFVRVAESFGGGALIRGAGRGVMNAGRYVDRRWFADLPDDPAPVPPDFDTSSGAASRPDFTVGKDGVAVETYTPEQQRAMAVERLKTANPELASTRGGQSRVINDLDEVTTRLDNWDTQERPIDLSPRTDTAIPEPVTGVKFSDDVTTRGALGNLTVDELARKADPEAFRIYDTLAAKVEAIRTALTNGKPDTTEFARMITEANNRVSDLTDQLGNRKLSKAQRADLEAQRTAAMEARDTAQATNRTTDTPRQAAMREQLIKLDQKMRDMAPTVSRAYARARGSYTADAKIGKAVKNMVDSRSPRLSDADARSIVDDAAAMMKGDKPVPSSSRAPDGAAALAESPIAARTDPKDVSPGKPFVEAARKTVEKEAKLADESLQAFRDSLSSVLKDEKAGTVTFGDHTFKLSDKLEVAGLDGEGSRKLSVRDLLREISEADEDAKAVKTCSI